MPKNGVIKIGYQGREGSFTFQALSEYKQSRNLPQASVAMSYNTFDRVVAAFNHGEITEMFLGTANNNSGCVQAMALLSPVMNGLIVGEHFLHVRQSLLARQGVRRSEIRQVISQRPALEQCRATIEENRWTTIDYHDTALAAKFVSRQTRRDLAAIASPLAAELYGLIDLGIIADKAENFTRFLHIVSPASYRKYAAQFSPDKSYITTAIVDGPLMESQNFGVIASQTISISRFEPLPSGRFEPHKFLIDLMAHKDEPRFKTSARILKDRGVQVRIIGCYPAEPRPI